MIPNLAGRTLKRTLLLFWAAWLSLVFVTNVCSGLKALGVLPPTWLFSSGNYGYMVKVTAIYAPPPALVAFLFCGVVLWEGAAALLLWRLRYAFTGKNDPRIVLTFTVNLSLWLAFMLADELFMAYDVENAHRSLFVAQLATLLALKLLPDE